MTLASMDPDTAETHCPDVRLALIDDDRLFARTASRALKPHRFLVRSFTSLKEAIDSGKLFDAGVILLDVDLRGESGVEGCAELRRLGFGRGIIMLSGVLVTEAKVNALRAGADDYVTKPFDAAELAARIDAVLRRYPEAKVESQSPLEFGLVRLDPRGFGAWVAGEYKALAPLRYRLLELVVLRRGEQVTIDEIMAEVQGGHRSRQSAENLVWQLRHDIGCHGDIIRRHPSAVALSPALRRSASGVRPATGSSDGPPRGTRTPNRK